VFDLDGVLVDVEQVRASACHRLLTHIRQHGVETHPGSVRYAEAVRRAGLASVVISTHPAAREILEAAGIAHLFDERLDGLDAEQMHLSGKPAPDVLLAAVRTLWVFPAEAAVFDATGPGIAAARAGGFGYVVGVERVGRPQNLRNTGADTVVHDLTELLQET
jgi:HAD superfamily hydrolase (TIGR01509 family)